jgi:NAD(P)-dependent dehydrogenase (short-subunit alcohol dehydrogenase family)
MARPISNSGFRNWTPDRLPDLAGTRHLVTGGNAGLGYEASRLLAAENADVVIASRNEERTKRAVAELGKLGSGKIEWVTLDLSTLDSVRRAADDIGKRYDQLDAIVNNAGVMQTPETRTADGFELQLATNHLGHFLLNGLLFDLVEKAGGRIVAVSSIVHRRGRIHLDDLMLSDNYSPTRAYGQSKLANLIYALELDRRLKAAGSKVTAIACHPGYAATDLQRTGPRGFFNLLYRVTNPLFAQSAAAGAVPLALAAAGKEAKAGAYYGPTSRGDSGGPVGDSSVADAALDRDVAARLWEASEKLVGFDWGSVLGKAQAGT